MAPLLHRRRRQSGLQYDGWLVPYWERPRKCSSDLDWLHVGSTSDVDDCWAQCQADFGSEVVAVDWTSRGECRCQDACECMEDTDDDDIHLITGGSIATLPGICSGGDRRLRAAHAALPTPPKEHRRAMSAKRARRGKGSVSRSGDSVHGTADGDSCEPGYVADCSGDGDCCSESWIGDETCDGKDQEYGCDLSCYANELHECGACAEAMACSACGDGCAWCAADLICAPADYLPTQSDLWGQVTCHDDAYVETCPARDDRAGPLLRGAVVPRSDPRARGVGGGL